MLVYSFYGKNRELKKYIVFLLKRKLAYNIKRINYVKNYYIKDGKIIKEEEKIIYIWSDNKEKLVEYLDKEKKFKKW